MPDQVATLATAVYSDKRNGDHVVPGEWCLKEHSTLR